MGPLDLGRMNLLGKVTDKEGSWMKISLLKVLVFYCALTDISNITEKGGANE